MTLGVPVDENQEREGLVLALDVGTSSIRAALYTEDARELAQTQARTPTNINRTIEGGAELDAEEAVEQVTRTIDAALALSNAQPNPIETVAVSCFWHSLLGVDDEGRAVTPVLGWADTRAVSEAEELRLRLDERRAHARTGALFHPSYWPAKLLWLKRARPEIYNRVSRWMSFGEFLSLKLFGKAQSSVSMASGTGLFNLRSCRWDEELCRELNLSSEQLPVIAETDKAFNLLSDEYARRWPGLRDARWFPAIGDGAANSIGAGCTSPQFLALMIGTSGAMRLMFEGEPPINLPRGLWCYRADRRRVIVGGAISDGGGLWAWMNEALRLNLDEAEREEALLSMEADAHGLTVLPFWAGERSTGWRAAARGAIIGLSMHTRPLEIMRAAMEAVAYRLALIAEALFEFAPHSSIIASGGALHASRAWAQIISDALGRQLLITGAEESSSRGAVLLALEASDKIKSFGEGHGVTCERVIKPDMIRHTIYQKARQRQQQLYERLIEDKER
ncbi:MAG: gluconokinase [Pyrinomonadaceae bacterium]|nr:gluconokinase [Pyrinomonadaceae bacterium]